MSYTEQFMNELGCKSTINMASVIGLGFGPISAEKLAELVACGKVNLTNKGNEIFCQKNPNTVTI